MLCINFIEVLVINTAVPLATYRMRKSEEPLVVRHFLAWWLIDACGSSAILLAVQLVRIATELSQRLSNKYHPTGSGQYEDLATLGSVQLRQTWAHWTLASRLPGERPLLEMNGDTLWTQQCSSGVCSERRSAWWCQNIVIFDQYLANLGNDTRYSHSWYGIRIGIRMHVLKWHHFQWPWLTSNPDSKVMV